MPRDWIDRDDRIAGDCPAGPVSDEEPVARFLDSNSWKDDQLKNAVFEQKQLFPPKNEPINNTPGERHGESLVRNMDLADAELLALANARQNSEGAAIFDLSAIRQITSDHDNSHRLFRVYEDPTPTLPQHAVIRFDSTRKPEWAVARSKLLATFQRKV